jgi:L-asparaginase
MGGLIMKKLLLIATGGTIACSDHGDGLTPTFNIEELLEFVPEVSAICHLTGMHVMNIDSTNMNPEFWIQIGAVIKENYKDYDGFVITHGTDTMAYTSAGLSYLLQNHQKPIVVTGAQYSIEEFGSDAKQNLSDAIRYALEGVPGVFIAFDGKIINGTRAMKVKTKSLDAFQSVNYPYVAKVKYGKVYHDGMIRSRYLEKADNLETQKLHFDSEICQDVMVLKLFPGISPVTFDLVKGVFKGVIIESFGIGGIPFENHNIIMKVKELVEADIPVVVTTQCLEEGIDFEVYEVGKKLVESNIIIAKDMNTEAIVAKLMWALAKGQSMAEVKHLMEKPIMDDCMY